VNTLRDRHCIAVEKGSAPLDKASVRDLLSQVSDWELAGDHSAITRTMRFSDFHQTMAFVNALAWIANQEDHHPDLEVGYNRCTIRYSTHAAQGLTINDFICAAKIDALLL